MLRVSFFPRQLTAPTILLFPLLPLPSTLRAAFPTASSTWRYLISEISVVALSPFSSSSSSFLSNARRKERSRNERARNREHRGDRKLINVTRWIFESGVLRGRDTYYVVRPKGSRSTSFESLCKKTPVSFETLWSFDKNRLYGGRGETRWNPRWGTRGCSFVKGSTMLIAAGLVF